MTALFLFAVLGATAQRYQIPGGYGTEPLRLLPDSTLHVPHIDDTASHDRVDTTAEIRAVLGALCFYPGGGRPWQNFSALLTNALLLSDTPNIIPNRHYTDSSILGPLQTSDNTNYYNFNYFKSSFTPYTGTATESQVLHLNGDTLINFINCNPLYGGHKTLNDRILMRFSYNSGQSWGDTSLVYFNGNNLSDIQCGVMDNGRIGIWLSSTSDTVNFTPYTLIFIYSDNRGSSWSSPYTYSPVYSDASTYRKPIWKEPVSGAYYTSFWDNSSDELVKTTNNGLTWTSVGLAYDFHSTGSLFDSLVQEPFYIDKGDTVIILARGAPIGGYHQFVNYHFSSSPTSFTYLGNAIFGQEHATVGFVCPTIILDTPTSNIIMIATGRTLTYLDGTPSSNQNDGLWVFISPFDSVFSNTSGWKLKKYLQRPAPNYTNTYGYPSICKLDTGWYCTYVEREFLATANYSSTGVGDKSFLYSWWINPNIPTARNVYGPNLSRGSYPEYNEVTHQFDYRNYQLGQDTSNFMIRPNYPGTIEFAGWRYNSTLPVFSVRGWQTVPVFQVDNQGHVFWGNNLPNSLTVTNWFAENASGQMGIVPIPVTTFNGAGGTITYNPGINTILTNGNTASQKVIFSTGECIRFANGGPFTSFYDAAQATRTGYIQGNSVLSGSPHDMLIDGDNGAGVQIETGGVQVIYGDSAHHAIIGTGAGYGTMLSVNGTSTFNGNITNWTSSTALISDSTARFHGGVIEKTLPAPMLVGSGNLTAQTSVGNIATFTPGATGTFDIGGYCSVTAVTTDVLNFQVTFSDENGTSRTLTIVPTSGSANMGSTGFYGMQKCEIRAGTGSTITVKTTLQTSGGTITFDTGATIVQIQ